MPVSRAFGPGETVPHTAIYRANHKDHRPAHEGTLLADEVFPACRICGSEVTFLALEERPSGQYPENLGWDYDFWPDLLRRRFAAD
jgi:hypothetical protein